LGQEYGEFEEMREWLRFLGITIRANTVEELEYPDEIPSPDGLHKDLSRRFRQEGRLFLSRSSPPPPSHVHDAYSVIP
jgi:hypothetical protein